MSLTSNGFRRCRRACDTWRRGMRRSCRRRICPREFRRPSPSDRRSSPANNAIRRAWASRDLVVVPQELLGVVVGVDPGLAPITRRTLWHVALEGTASWHPTTRRDASQLPSLLLARRHRRDHDPATAQLPSRHRRGYWGGDDHAAKEVADVSADLLAVRFQREVPGIEQVELPVGKIAAERLGARGAEDLVVLAPGDQ